MKLNRFLKSRGKILNSSESPEFKESGLGRICGHEGLWVEPTPDIIP